MKQYEMFRLEFTGNEPEGSASVVNLRAAFTCNGVTRMVDGFYAGEGRYEIRYLPEEPGMISWAVEGIFTASGEEECLPADGSRHGLVKADGTQLRYEDGTPFYSVGTTVYAMMHQTKELIEQTKASLKASPFNKVRTCVFPKHYVFNENEPELFAFQRLTDGKSEVNSDENPGGKPDGNAAGSLAAGFDFNRPCYAFWDVFDRAIEELGEAGIQVDIILFHPYDCWGFAQMSREQYLPYLHYLLARFAAHANVWWSLANEYDCMHHFTEADWNCIGETIHEKDIYGHMLSCHYMLKPFDYEKDYVTHASVQGDVTEVENLMAQYHKPVLMDEFGYEGNIDCHWGHLSGFELVNRFWLCCVMGGYGTHGETFVEDHDILWWGKGGVLRGQSVPRIAFLRKIMESLPGHLEPVPFGVMDPEKVKAARNHPHPEELPDFARALLVLPDEKIEQVLRNLAKDTRIYTGHCGEEAYLAYYGRHCTAMGELELPENAEYCVEIIDVWEMTRTVYAERASGRISLRLPGKEGIAVLARKCETL